MSLSEVHLRRVMSPKQADELAGAFAPDLDATVTQPTDVVDEDTGELVFAYRKAPLVQELRAMILDTPMTTTYRASSGMSNISRTFGMAPRKPTQWREACAPTSLARERPEVTAFLSSYAEVLAGELAGIVPAQVQADERTIQQVLPEWRLTETALWTSGVINKTSQLPYHRDGFNFDAWSAMACLRRGTRGGFLHLPEYDFTVSCRDGYVAYWNGYRLLHGVTPITKVAQDGYRYTVVYYALRGMKDCHTFAVEQVEARERRTGREHVDENV